MHDQRRPEIAADEDLRGAAVGGGERLRRTVAAVDGAGQQHTSAAERRPRAGAFERNIARFVLGRFTRFVVVEVVEAGVEHDVEVPGDARESGENEGVVAAG